jgi:hypothetical protein
MPETYVATGLRMLLSCLPLLFSVVAAALAAGRGSHHVVCNVWQVSLQVQEHACPHQADLAVAADSHQQLTHLIPTGQLC